MRDFGSVARGAERAGSDVDFPLDLSPGTGLFALGRPRRDLEDLLHARVDVIRAAGLKAEVRTNIEADMVVL